MGKLLEKFKKIAKERAHKKRERKTPVVDISELGIGAVVRPPTIALDLLVSERTDDTQKQQARPEDLRNIGGL